MQTDALIIGGGPVGSYAALQLAKLGVNAEVFEEHATIGLPSHCTGHISIKSLRAAGYYPLPNGIVENTFNVANFYSPQGTKFALKLKTPVTCALNRAKFDQHIASQAQTAGATYHLDTPVQSLILKNGAVKGVNLKDGTSVSSKIVLDCEGISSRLLHQSGLKSFKPSGLVYGVEAEVDRVQNVEAHAVEVYLGQSVADGFYGWVVPRPDGTAKVGLATATGNPKALLERLMTKHPIAKTQLAGSKIVKINYHALTLGGPISKAYTDGFLAVGDCASQVKPTTGGGVIFGLTCAKIAAEEAATALKAGDVSQTALAQYQKRCNETLHFDVAVMLRLRKFLNSLSDTKLDEVLRVCKRLGVDGALASVEEIDFQGQMILQVAKKPAMAAALAYFVWTYLTAKP
ncbi:MAG: NAD(P)/FAD-dependent oxidoreductase [Candidatus Bathyarchaeota archaeon]|nr:NAD(P)/FAD-dependent oxidoreductase [Candidatus Bathyarchaeota archaeon]